MAGIKKIKETFKLKDVDSGELSIGEEEFFIFLFLIFFYFFLIF